MNAIQTSHSASQVAASRALFARVSRKKAPVIVPISESAADPNATGPAFFCVHSISGAGGTDFLALARHLDPTVRMFGVQAPPKWMEDPSFGASVHGLGEAYASALLEAQPSGGFILAGWSAGAAIALEVAHSLRARGRAVELLVAIEGAPEIADAGRRPWDPRYWLAVAANLPAWFFDTRAMKKGVMMATLLRLVRSVIRRTRDVVARRAPEVAPRLESFISLDRYPPVQRQFMSRLYDAIMDYAPRPWDGPVVVYEARVTPALTLPQYLQRWRSVAPQAERAPLEGNHVTIMREPLVARLARDLEKRIARTVAADSQPG